MNGVPVGALLAGVAAAVLLAAALSAGETAVLRLRRADLAQLGASRLPSAGRVRRLMAEPHGTAVAAAWVRVVVEVFAVVAGTVALRAGGRPWWQDLLVAGVLAAVSGLILVRSLPRLLGRRHPAGALLVTSGFLIAARFLTSPLHPGRSSASAQHDLTDDEIRDMVERVSESEHIEDDERDMFRSVLELGDTITRAVMVPRTEMITLPRGTPLRKAMALFLRSGYSRVPVVGDSVDEVVGVLYLKDVVRHRHADAGSDAQPIDALVRPPAFVPESKPVDDLLREMQQGAFHMALVVDEFGGIAGLVTIEDALEEIVGELTDEHDRSGPEVEDMGDGALRVPSRMPLDELGELFDVAVIDDDVDTVGGLLAKALGKVPLVGASAEVAGLVLTADRADGRRKQVSSVLVRRAGHHGPDPRPQDTDIEGPTTDRARAAPPQQSDQGAHR